MTSKALLSTIAAAATIASSVVHADTAATRDPVISTQTGAEASALLAGGLGTTVGIYTVVAVVAGGIIVSASRGGSSSSSTASTFFIPGAN